MKPSSALADVKVPGGVLAGLARRHLLCKIWGRATFSRQPARHLYHGRRHSCGDAHVGRCSDSAALRPIRCRAGELFDHGPASLICRPESVLALANAMRA